MAKLMRRACLQHLQYLCLHSLNAQSRSSSRRLCTHPSFTLSASLQPVSKLATGLRSSGFASQSYSTETWRFGVPVSNDSTQGAVDWKWQIRKRIWDTLEAEELARDPRPIHNRIPNFFDADSASNKVVSLPEFGAASGIKVSSDIGQKQMRYLALRGGKILVTPQPRLQSGFFSVVEPEILDPKLYQEVATASGVAKYARPLGLGARFKVDLVVVGSVAVDPATGARLGEGDGLTELEYGFLRLIGAIDDTTVIVTSVHDKQLVNDIPVQKLAIHDFPVDVICTPTQIIRTNTTIPKPKGIYWEKLSSEKFVQFRILQELRRRIEQDTGQPLPVGANERPSPSVDRNVLPRPSLSLRPNPVQPFPKQGLFIWCFDDLVTPEELKAHLDKLGISVVKVDVFPKRGPVPAMSRALLPGGEDIDRLVAIVDKSDLRGQLIRCQVDKAYVPDTYSRRMR